jgi:gliding motility-associated lipoprotein GldD
MKRLLFPLTGLLLLALACQNYTPYPRPLAYPRIDLPAQVSYDTLQSLACPFTFEYPEEGQKTRDLNDSCWVDLHFPSYSLTWHITHRAVPTSGKTRSEHYEDYRRLVYKHTQKATQITETPIQGPTGQGIFFETYGEVGTPAQVFYYDSLEQHVMMLSFYFRTAEKNDSLAPVIDFMKGQVLHAVETLEWQ